MKKIFRVAGFAACKNYVVAKNVVIGLNALFPDEIKVEFVESKLSLGVFKIAFRLNIILYVIYSLAETREEYHEWRETFIESFPSAGSH